MSNTEQINVKEMILEGWLKVRVMIELIGKPKEHIEQTMTQYNQKIEEEKNIKILNKEVASSKEIETGSKEEGTIQMMWGCFTEIEMMIKDAMTLTEFCFGYMPSSVEIIEPQEVKVSNRNYSLFFNDFQARLHQLDLISKQTKTEVMFLRKSVNSLLGNYVTLLLNKQPLNAAQLSNLTGVNEKMMEEFLDHMTDQKRIIMDGSVYKVKHENGESS